MDLFNPPAIVRAAIDEAFLLVKSLARRSQADALELGKALLAAKESCPHGEWLARLKKAGVSERIAQRLMKKTSESQIRQNDVFDAFDEETENPSSGKKTGGRKKTKTEENDQQQDREPGDDTESERAAEEAENPYLKPLARHAEGLVKIAQEAVRRDIATDEVNWINQTLAALLARLRAAVMAPIRAEAPRPGKCKDCGRDVLWVKTTKGKNMPVDAETSHGGAFDIRNGVAHHVKYEPGRDWKLYRSHFQTCPERKKK